MPYRKVYQPKHHKADVAGFVSEHVLIAEKTLGRKLKAGEVIHHKNWHKWDNSPENLLFPITRKEHQQLPAWQARFIIAKGLYNEFLSFWRAHKDVPNEEAILQNRLVEAQNKKLKLEKAAKCKKN